MTKASHVAANTSYEPSVHIEKQESKESKYNIPEALNISYSSDEVRGSDLPGLIEIVNQNSGPHDRKRIAAQCRELQ